MVHDGPNPTWTAPFVSRYDHGTELLFFVEVFVENRGIVRGMRSLGTVAFNVKEILDSKNKVMARKLRDGGGV
jgi:hypothetical protein